MKKNKIVLGKTSGFTSMLKRFFVKFTILIAVILFLSVTNVISSYTAAVIIFLVLLCLAATVVVKGIQFIVKVVNKKTSSQELENDPLQVVGYVTTIGDPVKDKYRVAAEQGTAVDSDGFIGERDVIDKLLPFASHGSKFLHNLYIPKENGTTEIDLLMISPKGVFVFEVKNYNGWIYGDIDDAKWTQVLPQHGRSHKEYFYNPIMQNTNHIKHLQNLIGNIEAFSVIVFSDKCKLKTELYVDAKCKVIHTKNVYDIVRYMYDNSDLIFSQEIINGIYEMLLPYETIDQDSKQEHIVSILERKY